METTLAQQLSDDAIAMGCRRVLDEITPALARTAARFVGVRGWVPFGYARVDDYAHEQLGRSGRWLRNLAVLDDGFQRFKALRIAFEGADGGRPLGQVAAQAIGQVADETSVSAWIDLARLLPVRQFNDRVRSAREAGSSSPLASPNLGVEPADEGLRVSVSLDVPDAVRVAFTEATELHRMVCGSQLSTTAFVESLVAEASTVVSASAFETECGAAESAPKLSAQHGLHELESILFESTEQWAHLETGSDSSVHPFVAELSEAATWVGRSGIGGTRELHTQLRALIRIEGRLERVLAEVLLHIGHERAWNTLGFTGLRHYSEQRLGLRSSTTRDRVHVARRVGHYPSLHAAYESGEIGFESTLILLRIFTVTGAVPPALEQAWIARAATSTTRRLRDEARLLARRAFSTGDKRSAGPMTDEEWYRGLHHRPGQISERFAGLCRRLRDDSGCEHRFTVWLPPDLAGVFRGMIEAARETIESQLQSDRVETEALRLARQLCSHDGRIPEWVGLLALLEDFINTWDHAEDAPRRSAHAIYAREGWRCAAPGCTSRANLESHHIHYLSRGGHPTAPSNQVCLCRFHHQLGEHGPFAECRGSAPLGLVWELGLNGMGGRFKNDRRAA